MKNKDFIDMELKYTQQKMQEYVQKHWQLFLIEGIFFILLGLMAVAIPQFFSVVIVIFLGWIIGLAGVIHAGRALFFSAMPGFGLWLALGLLQIAVGYLLITDPIAGITSLTMIMVLFFALEGVIKMYLAFMMRPIAQWNFVLFSGMTSFLFAAIILVFWPETVHWLLGLFLGINMVVLGWSMAKMSLSHKDS